MKAGVVGRGLIKKGFVEDARGHHKYYTYKTIDGRITAIKTKLSHGRSGHDLTKSLISAMAKQCHLSNKLFRKLVSCEVSASDYEAKLSDSLL